ncbi:MAG TPA: GatB/YqeY domain-containing protein [Nannocystaceae bacterium]|nr:GatB/YqeY domain-containing protein [Nannocystaceae bacterium]
MTTPSIVREQIDALLKQARLQRDEPTKNVIGMLKNKVLVALKAGTGAVEDDKLWMDTIQAYAKEVGKAIASFEAVGDKGAELLAEARFELAFCERFLPTKLDEAATTALLRQLAADNKISDPKQVGKLVGLLMKTHRDTVDAALARKCAEQILAGG